jgi:hypothetical protein
MQKRIARAVHQSVAGLAVLCACLGTVPVAGAAQVADSTAMDVLREFSNPDTSTPATLQTGTWSASLSQPICVMTAGYAQATQLTSTTFNIVLSNEGSVTNPGCTQTSWTFPVSAPLPPYATVTAGTLTATGSGTGCTAMSQTVTALGQNAQWIGCPAGGPYFPIGVVTYTLNYTWPTCPTGYLYNALTSMCESS